MSLTALDSRSTNISSVSLTALDSRSTNISSGVCIATGFLMTHKMCVFIERNTKMMGFLGFTAANILDLVVVALILSGILVVVPQAY